ncbi:MAG: hypothetical protein HY393_00965 [Candidatus Diapherotrites archaeon]|nr:hypothetical protein [Candidatus Diapherotrites archaeon]
MPLKNPRKPLRRPPIPEKALIRLDRLLFPLQRLNTPREIVYRLIDTKALRRVPRKSTPKRPRSTWILGSPVQREKVLESLARLRKWKQLTPESQRRVIRTIIESHEEKMRALPYKVRLRPRKGNPFATVYDSIKLDLASMRSVQRDIEREQRDVKARHNDPRTTFAENPSFELRRRLRQTTKNLIEYYEQALKVVGQGRKE